MFLIAKIVRGRRLLHQLEEEEKAKERERQQLMLVKMGEGGDLGGAGGIHQDCVTTTAVCGGVESTSGDIELADLPTVEADKQLMRTISQDGESKAVSEDTARRRQRAVRQRTDSSLPSADEEVFTRRNVERDQIRRTSSMPSVVDALDQTGTVSLSPKTKGPPRIIKHYNYEDRLSKLHKRALRFTWHRLMTRNGGKRIETVFEEVFERMMRQIPVMREMFNTRTFIQAMTREKCATPRDHARLIVRMFEAAIKNLETEDNKRTDTASEYDPKLIGRAHASLRPYGFTSALWEAFGESIIDVVLNQEAVRDLPGASQAWVVLTACLVDQLRAGYESVRECPFSRKGDQQVVNGIQVCCPMTGPENKHEEVQDEETQHSHQRNQISRKDTLASSTSHCSSEDEDHLGEMCEVPNDSTGRRCFSILREGSNGRTELKILHDMNSTEL